MDAFFASVEQRDFPELRGKPVAVGGTSKRGVVAAASYEARQFGVHSAMPSARAAKMCPGLIFVKSRFEAYRQASKQIRTIFDRYTDLVEPLSLDEAYLDVTRPVGGPASATSIARKIKEEILAEVHLTASAGVSFNKFLAKIGSDMDKPDGLTVIRPSDAHALLARLPIGKFHGVGPVTARKMNESGIRNGADLMRFPESELNRLFGKAGRYYYRIIRCIDDRPVQTTRSRKSLGAERTFEQNISSVKEMESRLKEIVDRVTERMEKAGVFGQTVTLKIKYHDFEINTRQTTRESLIWQPADIMETVSLLLRHAPEPPQKPVRLLGVSLSGLRNFTDGLPAAQLKLEFAQSAKLGGSGD
mgnify:FL=1